MSALLEVRGLHAYYDKSHVLHGIDLDVPAGAIVSLIGRNGSGRSTTIKAVMNEVRHEGSIRFNGRDLAGLPTHQVARLGIGYVPEDRQIFPNLTVRQNLLLGCKPGQSGGRWSFDDMYAMFPRLRERENVPGGVLSGGEQQMLTVCRTLMGNPDLIMIDEPTEGVAPMIVEQLGRLFVEIARRGVAIVLVEQKLMIALRISQVLYVIGHGEVVFRGTPDELAAAEDVRKEWLEV